MRRRSFLMAASAAAMSLPWKGAAQASLGTLAWVEAGSLWIRELPDGHSLNLASGDGLHAPRLSASGRWVSFRNSEEKLSVVRCDGKSGTSLEGDHSVWFPHEDRLATSKDEGGVLVFGAVDGWKGAPFLKEGLPVFAPDGDRFVFDRDKGSEKDDVPAATQLCAASLAAPDRKPEILVSNKEGDLQIYGWTRDGKSVVYWRSDERSASLWSDGVPLYSVAASGGPERSLGTSTLVHDDILEVAPASAGNHLAVTNGFGRNTWNGQRIAVVDTGTGTRQNLTAADIAALCPAWSPDGKSIAYTAAPDAEVAYQKSMAGTNIRIMRPDGVIETKPVTAEMHMTPSGGEPAHAFLQQRKIWLVDPSGKSKPWQLTGDSRYRDEEPLWSADGSHILFGRMDYDGRTSLWLMESSGAAAKQVCGLQIFAPFGDADNWFGYYGYTDWRDAFDWRRNG